MDLSKPQNVAQERWLILRNALFKKYTHEIPPCSIRNHNSLDTFVVEPVRLAAIPDDDGWQEYMLHDVELVKEERISALVRRPVADFSLKEFQSPDNTGNVCIWASEQAMARYLIKNIGEFNHSSVIELGGGYSCLAGVLLAKYCSLERMMLSDGNETAVENIKLIAHQNNLINTEVLQLRWNDRALLSLHAGMFHYALAADCTFRDDQRMPLLAAINILLQHSGIGIIFSPNRGAALADFISMARDMFGHANVEIIEKYDDKAWGEHLSKLNCSTYRFDIHYPICVRIRKI